jgi:hypothetical protein
MGSVTKFTDHKRRDYTGHLQAGKELKHERQSKCSVNVSHRLGLKGSRFPAMEDIKSNATADLRKMPSAGVSKQDRVCVCVCVCVCAQGSYFEDD